MASDAKMKKQVGTLASWTENHFFFVVYRFREDFGGSASGVQCEVLGVQGMSGFGYPNSQYFRHIELRGFGVGFSYWLPHSLGNLRRKSF